MVRTIKEKIVADKKICLTQWIKGNTSKYYVVVYCVKTGSWLEESKYTKVLKKAEAAYNERVI